MSDLIAAHEAPACCSARTLESQPAVCSKPAEVEFLLHGGVKLLRCQDHARRTRRSLEGLLTEFFWLERPLLEGAQATR